VNIAHRIAKMALKLPQKPSVVHGETFYTFKEFEERSNQFAHLFTELGIKPGMRTLLFVKPCLDFSIITFALFKLGAVPVLIDPGMGLKNLLRSIKQVRPEAMISIGLVHWIRRFVRSPFSTIKTKISLSAVGGRTHYIYEKLSQMPKTFAIKEVSPTDLSAILFTSGGTGIPKGVEYTHGILAAQTDALQKMFKLDEKEVDLPGFPLFALFTLAMGMTSVIPDLDPTRPASCDPKKIVHNIIKNQVTFVAGSPAIWERVGEYCLQHNIQLGSVKYVVMFGAPVRAAIHQMFQKILPFGDTYTPYGATEALPVSLISGSEVLQSTLPQTLSGGGICIGRPAPGIEWKIIKISDIPEALITELPQGSSGEIIVSGPQVTSSYFGMEMETKNAKIVQDGKLWHRMGDIGRIDESGRLWFLGRKTHRVDPYFSIQIEAVFNQHPLVRRSALVKLNTAQGSRPALVIERWDGETNLSEKMREELIELGKQTEASSQIQQIFVHGPFPVDVRHNIKIDRLKLAAWAQNQK
jgi:acyl-CoA synthetase (AMP-forming)/AMP-acid ligase II